ncbi:hypothetical protein HWV62_32053 [Athelia sp. TMB]|nr:hypothetical protein HWV62_32053 [Athelia sp. TMB]
MEKTLAAALGFIVLAALYLVKASTQSRKYPPGPRGWPVIGNLLDIPTFEEWVTYKSWSDEFTISNLLEQVSLRAHPAQPLAHPTAQTSHADAASVSSLPTARAPVLTACFSMGWTWWLLLMPNNSKWKSQRRLFRQQFDGGAIKGHYPSVVRTNRDLLRRFIEQPANWRDHFRHMMGATILETTYGIKARTTDDPYIKTAEDAAASAARAIVPGAFMVDIFPFLRYVPAWVPGAGFQTQARVWKKDTDTLFNAPFDAVKAAMADGTSGPSFCMRSLQDIEGAADLKAEEHHIQSAAAGMYIVTPHAPFRLSDTPLQTLTFLETFILAMVLHPAAQKKAQAELDALLCSERLPTFADQEHLPYLAALVKECWRWQVGMPLGIAHQLAEDDEYRGFFIPKGTIVLANSHQVMNDPAVYPDPSSFKPERFLKDGKADPAVRNPAPAAFGYGRRACPGRPLAEHLAWLSAASILALFDLSKVVDRDGKVVEPSGRYTSGVHPEPFECQIVPRPSANADLIQSLANPSSE